MTYPTIEAFLDAEGHTEVCDDCQYFNQWTERHPYGNGCASERLAECTAPKDELCPMVENNPCACG